MVDPLVQKYASSILANTSKDYTRSIVKNVYDTLKTEEQVGYGDVSCLSETEGSVVAEVTARRRHSSCSLNRKSPGHPRLCLMECQRDANYHCIVGEVLL